MSSITTNQPIAAPQQRAATIRDSITTRLSQVRIREATALGAILLLAAIIRNAWIVRLPMPVESDYATFLDMATKIAHGHWNPQEYGWVYQGSGYPLIMSPLIALGGGLDALRLLNVVAQLGMVTGVWFVARQLFGPRGALVAGTFAAILPGLWSWVPLLAAESVATLLVTVLACLLVARQTPLRLTATGLTLAALAFTRPSFLPYVALVVVVIAIIGRSRWHVRLAWLGTGIMLVALPIMVLNAANSGPLLPGGAAGWQTWLVNNEHSTGGWFDAYADDAYPFTGLVGDAETRAAQSKLGVQFAIANPGTAISGAVDRLQTNWQYDAMGFDWTVERSPQEWQDRVPDAASLKDIAQVLYVVMLGAAMIGAIRNGRRPELLLPLVLPLAYGLGILAVAEANARYHVMFLPLLCIMAGGAIGSQGRASARFAPLAILMAGIVGIAVAVPGNSLDRLSWSQLRFELPLYLVVATVVIPVAGCIGLAISRLWTRWSANPPTPTWRWTATGALGLLVVLMPVWLGVTMARDIDRQLDAVAPSGWVRTVGSDPEAQPLVLAASGTAPNLRQVSYPDAALLQFDTAPIPGDIVSLTRTLDNLTVGEAYVFYLQVYDPGIASEHLAIDLNGTTTWELAPDRPEAAGWHYVRLDWVAGGPILAIEITRMAGTGSDTSLATSPQVRTLHLYPEY